MTVVPMNWRKPKFRSVRISVKSSLWHLIAGTRVEREGNRDLVSQQDKSDSIICQQYVKNRHESLRLSNIFKIWFKD